MKLNIINLSGFGEWGKTERNPSALLLKQLTEEQVKKYNIQSIKILQVTKEACDDFLLEINHKNSNNIHLGLFDESNEFQIESCAFNKLDYPLSDFNGCKIRRKKIDEKNDMDDQIQTQLNYKNICNQLQAKGYKVKCSYNPGRFLCNYIYYQSLKLNRKTLFIHVPLFQTIDETTQFNFLIDLLEIIQPHN